jgi:hypothetical protein
MLSLGENQYKVVQFFILFHILQNGQPLLEHEYLKPLFDLLKMKTMSKKHWTNAFGWVMGEHIHLQVLKALKVIVMGV